MDSSRNKKAYWLGEVTIHNPTILFTFGGSSLQGCSTHTPKFRGEVQWVKKQVEKDKDAEQKLEVYPMFCTE